MGAAARKKLERIAQSALARVHAGDALTRFVEKDVHGELRVGSRTIPPESGIWVAALGKAAPSSKSASRGRASKVLSIAELRADEISHSRDRRR